MPLPRIQSIQKPLITKKTNKNNEQYKIVLSNTFKKILNIIDHPISKKLLFLNNNSDYGFSISYIDIGNQIDMISYTPSKKIIEIKENNLKDNIWLTNRNNQKIGRFIYKLTGENSQVIESFVNIYKSEIKSFNNLNDFNIVKGEEITKYYNIENYSSGGGSLNKSCMRHKHCQDYFYFYNINPDKINLVILYDDDNKNKILGRAILWKIDEPKITLLDRIYTSNDSDQNLFIKLAIKNGWYYKKTQTCDEKEFINPFGKKEKLNCKIYLKNEEHRYFPYLDTFYFYDKKHFYITNDNNEYENNKYIIKLKSTDGGNKGNSNFIFDTYNNDYVKICDTVYCELIDKKILKNDAISLNNKYCTPNDVRFSEYDGNIYFKNDVIWSSVHYTFILRKNSFKVYFDKDMKKYDFIHSDFKNKTFEYVHNKDHYFIKDLLIKGIDNNFYIKTEYNEKEVKKRMNLKNEFKSEKLNLFFDDFIYKISKFDINYGTFDSTYTYTPSSSSNHDEIF